ncbi:quattro isoform X2 [Hemibagrus wyckioides]|uniref:quattro isoform X2 n=1 Tax=Hemibagrus wyckioides TaxID=337641 RepID=UPI00266BD7AD|nr:quattro isoform X2 [Hemibagrus wyckioides]
MQGKTLTFQENSEHLKTAGPREKSGQTSSSLDWSIQSALSSLYPPFEATAPTVLSQLFRTIEARYQGDALQCFLDYLIPAKHILESVQQAACAEYSDVLFQCEGWPLCLRNRVVIQLAPINPLLLRPGDFYLQVEPFGEQSARIVLKSLLVQEDILAEEDLVLLAGFRAQEGPAVEETPIPETSYPCIFTEAWLKEINEGRHGNQLHQCVLSSDQGIVKVPWAEVINPEFLDRPKAKVQSKTSCTTADLIKQDNSEDEPKSQFPVNMSFSKTPKPETMILPAKNGVAGSHQLVKSGNKFVRMEQRKPVSNPVGKPVGWVSPNTWDSRSSQELEGEYVDLLDFAKEKDALSFKMSVTPSVPMSFRPHSPLSKEDSTPCVQTSGLKVEHCVPYSRNNQIFEDPQKGSESKGRHRQSYLAAIKNPVSFEKANTIVPLEETWPGLGEAEPGYEVQEIDLGIDSLSNSPVQGSSQLGQNLMQSCPDSAEQDQNSVQMNKNAIIMSLNTALPSVSLSEQSVHLLTEKPSDSLQKTVPEHTGAVHFNRQQTCPTEQEPHQMWTNVHKHHKTQHLPKMGLRALPDHRSHRQETGGYKCQGVGKGRQTDQFVYGFAPLHKSFQQPTGQRPSLIPHPQKSMNMLQEQNSQVEQKPKQCGENPVLALKSSAKSRPKARSASSVSESARECSQEDRPASRSRSDVCPEVIPMVPGVQVQRSKKCTSFGLVSPKLDRRKAAKNAEQITALQNGAVLQSSSAQLQNLSPEHGSQITALSHDPTIKNVLQLGIICLPGSRDRAGRAVLEVHGGKNGWTSPLLSPLVLCKLVLYLHSIPRRQVRDLGLTVIINSRNAPIPSMLCKALLMVQDKVPRAVHSILLLVEKDQSPRADRPPGLQMDIITSVKALQKSVDGQQLTSELGGSFPYNHTDWLQFYQKLFLFEMDLQGAALLLQSAIRKLDSNKKTDTAEDVRRCSEEQKGSMKQVLEDTHMVKLQRDGGAILARMRKEECRFAQSEDYRDSMDAVMCLYNQVEEGVHTLVMRSNQSLQHLDHVLLLRETEEQLNKIREWCEEEARRWQKDLEPAEDSREILEQRLTDIHAVLTQAEERKEKAKSLMKGVERKIQGTCYPETDIFHIHLTKFKTNLAAFMLQAEQRKSDLEAFIRLFHFCEQAFTLTKECSHYLEHMEMGGHTEMANIGKLKSFQERFKAFSHERFEEEKSNAMTKKHQRVVCVWSEACSLSQEVKQRLEEKLLEFDKKQKLQRFPQRDEMILKNDEVSCQNSSISISSLDNVKVQSKHCEAPRQTQGQNKQARDESVKKHKESTLVNILTDKLIKFPREHHSEADLRNIDLFGGSESNRALGRSHSEGSCIRNFSPMLTGPPLSSCQKIYPSKPNVLLADRECVACRQDSFCSDFSNMKLEWIQMDIRDKPRVTLDDHDSQISRQESFCSSVSSPRQGWMKEEKSSKIYMDDRNSGYPTRDLITPDRLMDTSDCNSASELENSSNLLKLQHIMEELLQTEREYVRALGYVMEHYFPELERQDVPQDLRGQRGSIFGNLEKLREFHQHHFLKELELCLRHPFRVGRCFLRHKESFGLYALYSKNKPRSDSLLINHGKEFFKKQQLLGDKMDLSSYLLKPVQRISKYSLLLQDMLQECDATSHKAPERAELQAALEVIQFQLRHGNNLLAMDDIQECDVNLKEQGQLIRQDEFLVFFRKKKYHRHIFLFQDLILFSKTKKTEVGNDIYIYKQSFKTSDIGMTVNCGDSGLCFEIWFRRRKSQDTYTLQARSYEVKEDWTKDLEKILWDQAIYNRGQWTEIRMQERVFMGIGCKPFMDIKPSEAAICDRAIKCALTGRDCKAPVFSGMSNTERGFPVQRPNSTGSASYVSSCSHSSSSSSSGRGSVSPVGYHIGRSARVVSVSDPGRFSNPGEHDLDQENVRQNQLVDSSESSVESISCFSSSGYSFQSVIGGEHEVHSLELSDTGLGKPCPHKMEGHQQHKDNFSKPQNQKRDQPLKVQGNNHMGKSTEV